MGKSHTVIYSCTNIRNVDVYYAIFDDDWFDSLLKFHQVLLLMARQQLPRLESEYYSVIVVVVVQPHPILLLMVVRWLIHIVSQLPYQLQYILQ